MKKFTIMYDISQNKKRTRLVKILEEFGERVQYSVFEFNLTEAQYVHIMQRLKKAGFFEDHQTDKVRMYHFDVDQSKDIVNFGKSPSKDKDKLLYI